MLLLAILELLWAIGVLLANAAPMRSRTRLISVLDFGPWRVSGSPAWVRPPSDPEEILELGVQIVRIGSKRWCNCRLQSKRDWRLDLLHHVADKNEGWSVVAEWIIWDGKNLSRLRCLQWSCLADEWSWNGIGTKERHPQYKAEVLHGVQHELWKLLWFTAALTSAANR